MSDYTRGEMEIAEQNKTFNKFMDFSVWGTGLLIVSLLFFILVFAANISWFISLVVSAIVGIIFGLVLKLSGGWYATVIGLSILGFFGSAFVSWLA